MQNLRIWGTPRRGSVVWAAVLLLAGLHGTVQARSGGFRGGPKEAVDERLAIQWTDVPPDMTFEGRGSRTRQMEAYVQSVDAVQAAMKEGMPSLILFRVIRAEDRPGYKAGVAYGDKLGVLGSQLIRGMDYSLLLPLSFFRCVRIDLTEAQHEKSRFFQKAVESPTVVLVMPDGDVKEYEREFTTSSGNEKKLAKKLTACMRRIDATKAAYKRIDDVNEATRAWIDAVVTRKGSESDLAERKAGRGNRKIEDILEELNRARQLEYEWLQKQHDLMKEAGFPARVVPAVGAPPQPATK